MPRWTPNVRKFFEDATPGKMLAVASFSALFVFLGFWFNVFSLTQKQPEKTIEVPVDAKKLNSPEHTPLLVSRLGMLLRKQLTEVAREHAMKKGETIFVQRILDPRRWGSEQGDNIRGVLQNVLSSPEIGLRLEMIEPFRADYALQGILMDIDPDERELQLEFLRRTGSTWETLATDSISLTGIQEAGNPDPTYRMVCGTARHPIQCHRDGHIDEENCKIGEALRFARVLAEVEISQRGGTSPIREEQQLDRLRDRFDRDVIEKESRATLFQIEDGDLPRLVGRSVEVQRCARVRENTSSP
uniref:Uncharacterized protein n=1 Tax=Candidatus Kentrum sp. FM TaxID=2126340 RepID=A0A450RYY1_9GAMM|nr:MAG: hypothetical protein BECKFM1743A_GA0114220_100141 [Candidatus Kentron sp. FM]VFJ44520.1 MAG: hypothetical protein BECKFM1743C_GA0114222_100123 [Candidatus Kentron sp. FM]VFK05978.1 MAG: hypothetical protein BECKFM1743B_GA0114221_100088 [Candidatus Kentron sp. FM]